MAKQVINVGTTANDKKGDSLRAAFQKVNTNFTELYTALGLVNDLNINLGNFVFTENTMRLTNSTGDDSTATRIEISQPVRVEGDLTVGGDIVPTGNLSTNLGSPANKFHSIYVGTGSVYLGDAKISLENGKLKSSVGFDLTGSVGVVGGTVSYADITNKPTLSTVATSGSYADLTNKPTLSTVATSGSYADLTNKPTLFSGSYDDLTNKPSIPAAQVNSDWNASSGLAQILNKPTLFDGNYNSLTNKPTIPSAYTLPTATTSVLGGVKVDGTTITIDGSGIISGADTGNIEFRNDSMNDVNGITITNASQLTASTASIAIPANGSGAISITNTYGNIGLGTVYRTTQDHIYTNGTDFTTDVEIYGNVLPGWSQRNESQIEIDLFVPGSSESFFTGLQLGRTVIVTYSTNSGNQTLTRTLTQVFTTTGQADPDSPGGNWGRVSGRIDATLPAGQTGIVSINFPVEILTNKNWTFDTDGILTIPGNIRATSSSVFQAVETASLAGVGDTYTSQVIAGGVVGLVDINISNDIANTSKTWRFDGSNGTLTLPNGATFRPAAGNSTATEIIGNQYGWIGLVNHNRSNLLEVNDFRVTITANNNQWKFETDGKLKLPVGGDIVDSGGTSVLGNGSVSSLVNGNKTVSLGSNGTLTLPAQASTLQTFDQIFTTKIYRATSSTNNAAIQQAWDTYYGAEQTYQDIVAQDRQISGYTWPWDGLPSYEGQPLIANYNSSGQPVPGVTPPSSGLPPAASTATNAYIAYRQLVSNIDIVSGNKTFSFKNTGELSLPGTLSFADTNSAKIVLKQTDGYGIVVEDPDFDTTWTFGSNGTLTVPGNITKNDALILTSPGTTNTDLSSAISLLGDSGSILLRNWVGATQKTWQFDKAGRTRFPDDTIATNNPLILSPNDGIPNTIQSISNSSGFWEQNPRTNLATTGGSGSGLRVDVYESGGYAGNISIHTPGEGYTDGDSITVTSGNSSATFIIRVVPNFWTFGTDGTTSFPNDRIEAPQGVTLTLGTSTVQTDDNEIQVNGKTIDIIAQNIDDYSWAELFLDNTNTWEPRVLVRVKQATSQGGSEKIWEFGQDGKLRYPNNARQRDTRNVVCSPNIGTVIYTGTDQEITTIKLIVQAEGQEGGSGLWHTQSCEMLVAIRLGTNEVSATVYAVVHTSEAPIATFTAGWNSTSSRVEVYCSPFSTTSNVTVRTFATEIFTAD